MLQRFTSSYIVYLYTWSSFIWYQIYIYLSSVYLKLKYILERVELCLWKTTVIHCIVGNKGFVITTIGKNGTQAQNCDHHCMQLSNNYVPLNCDFPRSVFKNTSTYNCHYGIALNANYNFVVSYDKYV